MIEEPAPMPVDGRDPAWTVRVLTLFPGMFPGPLGFSLAGRALERGDWRLETVDIRDFARDNHRSVDDSPFGGGAGMVMRPDVVGAALADVGAQADRVVYLSPRGRLLTQSVVAGLARAGTVALLCGRYEGVDQRALDASGAEEISVGDYVLSGGETAALCLIDAVVRLLPGVMGNEESGGQESFADGLLEYPHYTRPARWTDATGVVRSVPEVLLSGHHARVGQWRREQSEALTRSRRPDLWARYDGPAASPVGRQKTNEDQ